MSYYIAPLRSDQIILASNIADSVYPRELAESVDVFRAEQQVFPTGAVGTFWSDCNRLFGYVFCFPWSGPLPSQNTPILNSSLTIDPAYFYIHDICLLPEGRKHGIASSLVRYLFHWVIPPAMPTKLTAVPGAESFWKRQGFTPTGTVHDYNGILCVEMEHSPHV